MKIFPEEQHIASKIKASRVIAYCSPVTNSDIELSAKQIASLTEKLKGGVDHKHLHPLKTVLVSTGWNRNDDVFLPEEVWAAKETPEDTPFNLEHNENDIIGHITANWVISDDGDVIETAENLPNKFHVVTTAVLYKLWENNELVERTQALLKDIEEGNLYVSMECTYDDFDYALKNTANNEEFILSRNKSTAYLTKCLHCFGGDGVYDKYKVGRVLKSICFCGKGLVKNPANPQSVIFNDVSEFNDNKASASKFFVTDGEKEMANENVVAKEVESLEKGLADLRNEKRELAGKLGDVEIAVASLEKKLAAANAEIEEHKKSVSDLNDKLKVANDLVVATKAEAEKSLKDKDEENKKYKDKAEALEAEKAEIVAKATTASRIATIKSVASYTDDEAAELAKKFAKASDDEFTGYLELVVKAASKTDDKSDVANMFDFKPTDKAVAGTKGDSGKVKAEVVDKAISDCISQLMGFDTEVAK